MKKLFTLVTLLVLIYNHPALACPRDQQNLICTGDSVVKPNGWSGVVLGINNFKKTAAVRSSNKFSNSSRGTYKISDLAIGFGCVNGYCVGDKVTGDNPTINGWRGTIIGVNPYLKKAAVKWHRSSDNIPTRLRGIFEIRDLAIGLGCVMGYCVGDLVIDAKGWTGHIIGVNAAKKNAGVKWFRSPDNISTQSSDTTLIENLSNSKFCEDYDVKYRSHEDNRIIFDRLSDQQLVTGLPSQYWVGKSEKGNHDIDNDNDYWYLNN